MKRMVPSVVRHASTIPTIGPTAGNIFVTRPTINFLKADSSTTRNGRCTFRLIAKEPL
jgi:hypothetical protein